MMMQPDNNKTWDSGGSRQTIPVRLSAHLLATIAAASVVSANDIIDHEDDDLDATMSREAESRSELDSHANMPVVGRHCHIISDTGKMADVSAHAPDYAPKTIPIVGAAL